MKPALPTDIFDGNMKRLKMHFPEVHAQLLGVHTTTPFQVQPFATPHGEINISATLPGGDTVDFYEETDITGNVRAKMADWQLETEDFLFCVGFGLGYVPLLASQQFAGKPRIVVIEPNPEVMRLALQFVDLQPLLAYERLDMHLGPDLPVADIIGKYGERVFFGKNRLISHGASRLLYGESFKRLEHDIIDNIRVVRNIGYTAKHAGKKIFANTMDNLPGLFSGPDLSHLKNRFKGCPAICVAAGPSLDKELENLKAVGNRALILCADSAVRSLVNAGIHPHMVVTTDMNPVNFEKLRTSIDHLRESVLVFSIEANPDNVRTFLGPRRIAVTSKNAILNRWLGPKWSLDWRLPAMTSVSHTALFTALALGACPIILVGMDFAYTDGKSHASGSVFRYPVNRAAAIRVEGVRGFPVNSLPQLITDRKQIENAMAAYPVRFVDVSLDGALIHGAENRLLNEVMDTMLPTDLDVSTIIRSIDWTPPVPGGTVIKEFKAMADTIDRFISTCQANTEKCLFDHTLSEANTDSQFYEQRLAEITIVLTALENENGILLSLLKLIRYGEVKEITRRLDAIRAMGQNMNDSDSRTADELEIYFDHYKSLENAARRFKESLSAVNNYLMKESEKLQRVAVAPNDFALILDLANYYRRHDLFWKAEQFYLQYFENRPDDIHAWIQLVRMFAKKRLWSLAQKYVRQMKVRFPNEQKVTSLETEIDSEINTLCNAAAASMEAGNPEEARRKIYEYHTVSDEDESSRRILEKINAYDRENALTMLQSESIHLSDEQKRTLAQRIQTLTDKGATEDAIGILEGLVQESDTDAIKAHEKIGDIRLSQDDPTSAVWHYRQALDRSPENNELDSKLKEVLQRESQNHNQRTTMTECSDHQTDTLSVSDTPEAIYRQAQTRVEQQDYPEAIQMLERLLARYPDFAVAHNDLGALYFNEGRTEKSFFHYCEATRIEPEHTVFQKNLADFYYVVNAELQPALQIYVDLLAKDPEDTETLLALGQICTELEKFDEAAVFFQRVLELDPMNSDAGRGLEVLSVRKTSSQEKPLQDNRVKSTSQITGQKKMPTAEDSPSPVIQTEIVDNDRRYVVRIPEQEVFRIKSIFELNEYAILEKRRGTGVFTVFDVGANVGIFSLSVHARHPHSRIFCFEPSPFAQTLLEANVGELAEMSICKYGLFNRDIQTTMHIHRFKTGQNSIRFVGQHHTDAVSIQLMDAGRQFDALGLSHLDILKIDTEGCELEILESMGNRLDMVDYVLLEYHSEKDRRAIDELLKSFCLFGSKAVMPGIGTVKYIHPALV